MMTSFTDTLAQRWSQLSRRDQKAVLFLAFSLTGAILIFGAILPTVKLQQKLETDLVSAQRTFQELQTLAPQAMASTPNASALNSNALNSEIRRQAARYGVVIQRFEPDGEQLRVWLENVRYPAFVQWLGALRSAGVDHRELALESRQDPGYISARISFAVAP